MNSNPRPRTYITNISPSYYRFYNFFNSSLSSFTILKCEKKLIEERLRFNEYYLRISPHLNKELDEERKNLNNELDVIQKLLKLKKMCF